MCTCLKLWPEELKFSPGSANWLLVSKYSIILNSACHVRPHVWEEVNCQFSWETQHIIYILAWYRLCFSASTNIHTQANAGRRCVCTFVHISVCLQRNIHPDKKKKTASMISPRMGDSTKNPLSICPSSQWFHCWGVLCPSSYHPGNYRPTNFTSALGKLIQHLILGTLRIRKSPWVANQEKVMPEQLDKLWK